MTKYLLQIKNLAPGDIFMLTGLARDLHRAYGNKHQVGVEAKFHDTRRHSPYIREDIGPDTPGVQIVKMSYKIEWFKTRKIHFCAWPHRAFEQATGIKVPLTEPHADVHIQPDETAHAKISGRYWIVVPGGKMDMPAKVWSQARFQEVVDKLRVRGLRFVQEGSVKQDCYHPALNNVTNVVGLTSLRDFMCNIHHADGVICAESFPMHAAAALGKPCVVLAGGRVEPWSFEYSNDWNMFPHPCAPVKVPHKFLHTHKLLDCYSLSGGKDGCCWRQRLVPIPDGNRQANKNLCLKVTTCEDQQPIAKCLDMITTEHVLDAVQWYYDHGFVAK